MSRFLIYLIAFYAFLIAVNGFNFNTPSSRYTPSRAFSCNPMTSPACRCLSGECPDSTISVFRCGRRWRGSQCCFSFWVFRCLMLFFTPGWNPLW